MMYHYLKIAHIFVAAMLFASMTYSVYLWGKNDPRAVEGIHLQTGFIIVPAAISQLLIGSVLIYLLPVHLQLFWVKASLISFTVLIGSWLGFIYFLLSKPTLFLKRAQTVMLVCCVLAFFSMIFLMTTKISYEF